MDLSTLSDSDLKALYQKNSPASPDAPVIPNAPDISGMSDEDLSQAYARGRAANYKGAVLPFSTDAQGNAHFDLSAGIPGMVGGLINTAKSGITAPSDAIAGKIEPSSDNPATMNRALDFTATTLSPVSAASRVGEIVPGAATRTFVPSVEQLKAAAAKGYDAARASPVAVPGEDIANMARGLQQTLQTDHGVIAKTAPKTFAILDELASPPQGALGTYPGLEAARRGLSTVAGEGGTEGFAAQKAIPKLDSFINTISPEAADARANYAAAMRSNAITGDLDKANTGIIDRAEARAHASHSGANIDNAIRQRVASFLQSPQNVAGFSQPEIDALNSVVIGGPVQNAARRVGNVFGGGGGLGQLAAGFGGALAGGHLVGGAEGGALGAMLPTALGMSAKGLENALARRSLNSADEMLRTNSPLARALAGENALLQPALGRSNAVVRSVMPGMISPTPAQPQSLAELLARGA